MTAELATRKRINNSMNELYKGEHSLCIVRDLWRLSILYTTISLWKNVCGVTAPSSELMQNYFTNHKQYVDYDGPSSDLLEIIRRYNKDQF